LGQLQKLTRSEKPSTTSVADEEEIGMEEGETAEEDEERVEAVSTSTVTTTSSETGITATEEPQ
jgi:hypothetical protein